MLVSDGFDDGALVAAALDYMKPVHTEKVIAAAPVATIPLVDYLHVAVDEMHILDVKENYINTNHYYEDNVIPTHAEAVSKINHIILNWR